jgi:hypothetical protein
MLLHGGLIKFHRGVWGYSCCHNCWLGSVAPSPLGRDFLFPAHVGFVFTCFLCVWVSVTLRACGLRGFALGHIGAFGRHSGVAVLFWCFGFVCSFRNWQCVALLYCILLLFCVYLVSLTLGFFSLTFQRTLGNFMTVAFWASWPVPGRPWTRVQQVPRFLVIVLQVHSAGTCVVTIVLLRM